MDRRTYIERVRVIERFLDEQDAVGSALQKLLFADDHKPCITFGSALLEQYMNTLEELSGDDAPAMDHTTWLRWYIWEARNKPGVCTVGGREYLVNNPSDLWRVLQAWKDHEYHGT